MTRNLLKSSYTALSFPARSILKAYYSFQTLVLLRFKLSYLNRARPREPSPVHTVGPGPPRPAPGTLRIGLVSASRPKRYFNV
jgi:hypothetical protein